MEGRVRTQTEPLEAPLEARTLRSETLIVLALSLGASGVSALISFIGSVTRPGALKNQAATLVGSQAPGRPWLDLAWQVFSIASALAPVALVAHLLARERVGMPAIGLRPHPAAPRPGPGRRGRGRHRRHRARLLPRRAGRGLQPDRRPGVAARRVVEDPGAGRLRRAERRRSKRSSSSATCCAGSTSCGWSPNAALAASALLRGSYHLYQGIGGFVGNMVMGVVFVLLYRRWRPGGAAGGGPLAHRHGGLRRLRAARGQGRLAAHRLTAPGGPSGRLSEPLTSVDRANRPGGRTGRRHPVPPPAARRP